jgi:pyruvate ferredoxin oxidoreductase alpha subunit
VKKVIEGLKAVAETVALCRPKVISAYPITPQTHIVEELAQIVADGKLKAEFINVESEFSAASVVLGASATGVRVYTATSSQGLLLMLEVLFNIAGMRLPVVLCCANRAVSAPINIWNDWQDALTVRDAGLIQLYAEDNQEACDMHIQAYKIAEDHNVLLPVIVNLDGFVLTHSYDPIEFPTQDEVDRFLPQYEPLEHLDVKSPMSFGLMAGPDRYMETRYALQESIKGAKSVIKKVAEDFKKAFGRYYGGLVEEYKTEDAEVVVVSMGSIISTIKDVVDELREEGEKIGVLKIRTYRPFPKEEVMEVLKGKKRVVIIEKCVSIGGTGILTADIKASLYGMEKPIPISNFIMGLGGRDIKKEDIRQVIKISEKGIKENEFYGLDEKIVKEMDV